MASILVIGEVDGGALTATTRELLGAATRLAASLSGGVSLALIGADLSAASRGGRPGRRRHRLPRGRCGARAVPD